MIPYKMSSAVSEAELINSLEYYPCFSMTERRSFDVQGFFRRAFEKKLMLTSGPIYVHTYHEDQYIAELGIREKVIGTSKIGMINLWKTFTKLMDEITYIGKINKKRERACDMLLAIVKEPSTAPTDLARIIRSINSMYQYIPTSEDDFLRDIGNTIFGSLLPYKLRGYEYGQMLDKIPNLEGEIPEVFQDHYLSTLLELFFKEVQSIRGTSLVESRQILNNLALYIYLFIQSIPVPKTEENLYLFESYINSMMRTRLGRSVIQNVMELINNPSDWFKLTSEIKPTAKSQDFLAHAIRLQNERLNTSIADVRSDHALDAEYNNTLISGTGYFSAVTLHDEDLEDFYYKVNQITPEFILSYINLPNNNISFQITENNMGFLKKELDCDVCKFYTKRSDGDHFGNSKTLVALNDPRNVYCLFMTEGSSDVYGISLEEDPGKARQIVKFGADKSPQVYSLIYGEN